MNRPPQIGGAPPVTIRGDPPPHGPAFLAADIAPSRGMMLLQARLRLPSGEVVDALTSPAPADAARTLDGGPADFAGNHAFSFGGAILAPYANRIRGRAVPERREIETLVDGKIMRLPRNWGGKATGAEQYAMHGLILNAAVTDDQPGADILTGTLDAGGFAGRWPSRTELTFEWRIARGALSLKITARNTGTEVLPIGLGWHPYFALPSGDRRQARLRLPAASRVEINDYDEVLPTGRLLAVAGTPYDFSAEGGAALGGLYLDDCFTDLQREAGLAVAEVVDPAAGLGLRITSPSARVKAIQVYAPRDRPFVVVEPQFNLADPYGAVWPEGRDTGMVRLSLGETVSYEVRVEPFALDPIRFK
ncbi:aldose 1-epimerase [Phenylobacterium sp.]|uniref:aldose 1-epimerase n=1 Tax=Phenylobacterium sp. TaxID=1871053 RepID=UPI00398356DB